MMLLKGKTALNERRVSQLVAMFEPSLVDTEILAADPKFVQLQADILEMAAQIGHAPPKILVTTYSIGMIAPSEKLILVAEQEFAQSTSKELKALAGHELGHIKRRDYLNLNRPPNHTQELEADRLGVELSGEPTAMISWLERLAKADPIAAQGNQIYPPISKRIEEIINAKRSSVNKPYVAPPPAVICSLGSSMGCTGRLMLEYQLRQKELSLIEMDQKKAKAEAWLTRETKSYVSLIIFHWSFVPVYQIIVRKMAFGIGEIYHEGWTLEDAKLVVIPMDEFVWSFLAFELAGWAGFLSLIIKPAIATFAIQKLGQLIIAHFESCNETGSKSSTLSETG